MKPRILDASRRHTIDAEQHQQNLQHTLEIGVVHNTNGSLCRCVGQLKVYDVNDDAFEDVDQTLEVDHFVFPPSAHNLHGRFAQLQEGTAEGHLQSVIVFGVFEFMVEGQCDVDAKGFGVGWLGDEARYDFGGDAIPDLIIIYI